jgi:hypothetical protein
VIAQPNRTLHARGMGASSAPHADVNGRAQVCRGVTDVTLAPARAGIWEAQRREKPGTAVASEPPVANGRGKRSRRLPKAS